MSSQVKLVTLTLTVFTGQMYLSISSQVKTDQDGALQELHFQALVQQLGELFLTTPVLTRLVSSFAVFDCLCFF